MELYIGFVSRFAFPREREFRKNGDQVDLGIPTIMQESAFPISEAYRRSGMNRFRRSCRDKIPEGLDLAPGNVPIKKKFCSFTFSGARELRRRLDHYNFMPIIFFLPFTLKERQTFKHSLSRSLRNHNLTGRFI